MNIPNNIDEGFIDIVNFINENGLKSYACCDGVMAHHDNQDMGNAYMCFLYTPEIIDIIAAFYRDKENFSITVSNNSYLSIKEYYGNLILGNSYGIYFNNKDGTYTDYFCKIIKNVILNKINISDEEKEIFYNIDEALVETEHSVLNFQISLSTVYQPYMFREGKTNKIVIENKVDVQQKKSIKELVKILKEEFGIIVQFDEVRANWRDLPSEFIACNLVGEKCEIYFQDDRIPQISRLIFHILDLEQGLPICDSPKELETDEWYLD